MEHKTYTVETRVVALSVARYEGGPQKRLNSHRARGRTSLLIQGKTLFNQTLKERVKIKWVRGNEVLLSVFSVITLERTSGEIMAAGES